jgi:hypothetical protein
VGLLDRSPSRKRSGNIWYQTACLAQPGTNSPSLLRINGSRMRASDSGEQAALAALQIDRQQSAKILLFIVSDSGRNDTNTTDA